LEGDVLDAVRYYGMQPGLSAIKSSFEKTKEQPYDTCLAVGIGIGMLTVAEAGERLDIGVRRVLRASPLNRIGRQSKSFKRTAKLASECSNMLIENADINLAIVPVIRALDERSAENLHPNPNKFVLAGLTRSLNTINALRLSVIQTL
jgi:hypothetical protein